MSIRSVIYLLLLLTYSASAKTYVVDDISKLQATADLLQAGDSLALGPGYWQDVQLSIKNSGTEEAPITLTTQTAGSTTLSGTTHIKIGGSHIIVKGLHFQNAYPPIDFMIGPNHSPKEEVNAIIDFASDSENYATDSQLTDCYFEACNPPEERKFHWVRLWGLRNRVDHCRFEGQNHEGVTVQVRLHLPDAAHQIDHNYFVDRQPGSGNGYECIQAGQSWASMRRGAIRIEKNIFEACNGETEIISSKTCDNLINNNLFLRSSGTLTIRHGNRTTAQNNIFIGDGNPKSGGIRIIGENHKVTGNYFHGINAFTGGVIVLYNGIPNGPINGYAAAHNAQVSNNLIIHCNGNALYFNGGFGSRNRTIKATGTTLSGNIIVNNAAFGDLTATGNLPDMKANDNLYNGGELGQEEDSGFIRTQLSLEKQANGLVSVIDGSSQGLTLPQTPELHKTSNVGISWIRTNTTMKQNLPENYSHDIIFP